MVSAGAEVKITSETAQQCVEAMRALAKKYCEDTPQKNMNGNDAAEDNWPKIFSHALHTQAGDIKIALMPGKCDEDVVFTIQIPLTKKGDQYELLFTTQELAFALKEYGLEEIPAEQKHDSVNQFTAVEQISEEALVQLARKNAMQNTAISMPLQVTVNIQKFLSAEQRKSLEPKGFSTEDFKQVAYEFAKVESKWQKAILDRKAEQAAQGPPSP